MRKAGLLDKKPLTATNKMLAAAKNDTGVRKLAEYGYSSYYYTEYESRYYFRAMMSANREILEVDLFTRKDLADGKTLPRFRIFLDREKPDFISWNMTGEKWSSARIDMLETGDERCRYSYRGRNYASGETLNTVNRYLKTGSMQDVETALIDFQAKVRGIELAKKHRLITDIIDGYMDTVPDRLPADWMKFINDRALGHSIMYKRGEKQGYCTHCRLHVPVPGGAKHNMDGKCTCGSRITYKSWQKQKTVSCYTKASVIQKCTDGQNYVYRQFNVEMACRREKEYVPEITVSEHYRRIFRIRETEGPLISAGEYEWGNFRATGITRWCEAGSVNHGGYSHYYYNSSSFGYAASILYTGNLKKLLNGTRLQYVPAADIIKAEGSRKINVLAALGDMGRSFPYEAYWKMGLKQFVTERIKRSGTDGLTKTFPEESKKPWDYLKITREGMKQAVRINATDQQMRIIQRASEMKAELSDEQVLWLDKYLGVSVLMRYFSVHTPYRIIRYLKEQVKIEGCAADKNDSLHFWTDYLDTAGQLGWDLNDRGIFFPQDIRRAHDEAAVLFTAQKDKEKAEEMKQKDITMHRNAREIKKAFCYRNEKYMIRVPGCYLDFKREGHAQHNCVATYYEKAVKGECIILFIRQRKCPEQSYCTVEIRNMDGRFAIMQNRLAYNKAAPEEAEEFLEKAVKEAQKIADRMAGEEKEELRIRAAV